MKKITAILLSCLIAPAFLTGCGQKEYYQAIEHQNETIQAQMIMHESEKMKAEQRHEEMTMRFLTSAMTAAAKTPDKTDDVLIPILIMNMEQQRTIAHALEAPFHKGLTLQKIQAPETVGSFMKNSTGLVLGSLGIYAGMRSSHNLAEVAEAGMAAAGTHFNMSGHNNKIVSDSYKTGSQNTIQGNSNTVNAGSVSNDTVEPMPEEGVPEEGEASAEGEGGSDEGASIPEKEAQECIANPPAGFNGIGIPLYTPNCSCKSHFIDSKC